MNWFHLEKTAYKKTNPVIKIAYFSAGILFTGLGIIGIIIPGLPTTIFMIVAAACFFHSSTRMYNWIVDHPLFGESVMRFREGKGMPKTITKLQQIIFRVLLRFK